MKIKILVTALVFAGAASLHAQPVFKDGYLVGNNGKTLYTFDKDSGSQSNCKDACLAQWPAYSAAPGAKLGPDLGLTSDGKQWTHRGKPLYFFVGDQSAGDRRGDRAGNVWHAIPSEGQTKTNDATQPKSAY